jgi:hypothetical protein
MQSAQDDEPAASESGGTKQSLAFSGH